MTQPKLWPCLVGGKPVEARERLDIRYPFDGSLVGQVAVAGRDDLERAIDVMMKGGDPLTRHQRAEILYTARRLLAARADEFSDLIRRETGLCVRDTRYEVGRAQDVLLFAGMEALRDDGQVFSGDISPQGKGPQDIHDAGAPSKRRGDNTVQSPSQPGRPQAGAGDRLWRARYPQALGEDALIRAEVRRVAVRVRTSWLDAQRPRRADRVGGRASDQR